MRLHFNIPPAQVGPLKYVLPLLIASVAGCTRAPVPEYSVSERMSGLPESHQAQISEVLTRYFGTPLSPRLLTLDETAEAESEQPAFVDAVDSLRLRHGAEVYRERCAGCHGVTGDGNGESAAYLQPKPRDYRRGVFKFTSTPYGAKPARSDLVRTIRRGAKGTSMPAFPWLSDEDVQAVIDYIILLSQRGEVEEFVSIIAESDYDEDEEIDELDFLDGLSLAQDSWALAAQQIVLAVTAQPAYTDESIKAGREAFLSQACWKCHGTDGEGQTEWLSHEFIAQQDALPEDQRIQINFDAWGAPAPAADLTARMLHGGRRPIDVYRRIYTGINGTPMPAFGQTVGAEEPETIWHLVHYVLSIIEGRDVDFSGITVPAESSGTVADQS